MNSNSGLVRVMMIDDRSNFCLITHHSHIMMPLLACIPIHDLPYYSYLYRAVREYGTRYHRYRLFRQKCVIVARSDGVSACRRSLLYHRHGPIIGPCSSATTIGSSRSVEEGIGKLGLVVHLWSRQSKIHTSFSPRPNNERCNKISNNF